MAIPRDWRIIGLAESGISAMLPPRKYLVEHIPTKKRRVVMAWDEDGVGEKIARGIFAD
jgi:hypothetical protein